MEYQKQHLRIPQTLNVKVTCRPFFEQISKLALKTIVAIDGTDVEEDAFVGDYMQPFRVFTF